MDVMAKIKSSTLIEIIISLVIITFVLGISMQTYFNIIKSNDSDRKTSAFINVNSEANKIIKQRKFVDQSVEMELFTIQMEFSEYQSSENLILMETKAIDKNEKVLYERKDILTTK